MGFDVNSYLIFLLASCRMAGMIFFNPIFGRKNIPNIVKVGLSLALALNVAYQLKDTMIVDYSVIILFSAMVKELLIGFSVGFMISMFMSIFHLGGGIIDMQIGLSMAQMYDPTSNSQISISGNIFTAMYTLLFFITNSHATLLIIGMKSFGAVPIGFTPVNSNIGIYFTEMFGYIFVYALQLALPILVTEIIVEAAVGILMRVVPNINVFVVNMQIKIFVGFLVIFTIIPLLVKFMAKLDMIMLERVQELLLFFVQ